MKRSSRNQGFLAQKFGDLLTIIAGHENQE